MTDDSEGWRELKGLKFTADGGVDWSQRPFAKRWSMRRLGRAGLIELLAEHVSLRAECYHLTEDAEPCVETLHWGVTQALRQEARVHHWFVHKGGRWLIELSRTGTFTFEFTSARNTRLIEKLRGLEREWARGNAPTPKAPPPRIELSDNVAKALQGMFRGPVPIPVAPGAEPQTPLERAKLSLLGLSIGDGFGEGFIRDSQLLPLRREPPAPWPWTDDTEMAASIVHVLAHHGGLDPDALAASFAARFDIGRGYGPAMAQHFFPRLSSGESWAEVASSLFEGQGSFGNGAAMRVAPLGAFYADDLDAVVEQARRSAQVTHAHPEGAAGAVAIALAAAWAWRLRDDPPSDPNGLLELVRERTPESEVRRGLQRALELESGSPFDAARALGNGAYVTAQDTVPFAVWSASRNLTRFHDALWETVVAEGDIDTTAAMVGGVVSLAVGEAGIPAEWRAKAEPLPAWL